MQGKKMLSLQESILRKTIPVVINSFNQLTYVANIVEKLIEARFGNIYILDQGSCYPPLLEYLDKKRHEVTTFYLPNNNGPHDFFLTGKYMIFSGLPFIYTDADMDWDDLHESFLVKLMEIAELYKVFKVGAALTIPEDDELKIGVEIISHNGMRFSVKDHESVYWHDEIEPGVFNSPVDTTFHLFNPKYYENSMPLITGLRVAGQGFSMRHLPWFANDPVPNSEYEYYIQRSRYTTCKSNV